MLKQAIFKFKIIPEIIPQQIQLMKLIQLLRKHLSNVYWRRMNESSLEAGKKRMNTRKTSLKTRIMMIMMMPNLIVWSRRRHQYRRVFK
jgi:hypothetical protein